MTMEFTTIIFYVFAILTLASATFVVLSRNIVRAAFALLFTLMGVAAFYALLMADFLAVTQLMVYVGGILVLLLFGVMLTNRQVAVDIRSETMQTLPAVFLVAAFAGTLGGIIWSTEWPTLTELADGTATAPVIGRMFLSSYLLPFEIASVILLVALIGAALIARRERVS
jgi:NADH-quinone oxidoreductase subunit J